MQFDLPSYSSPLIIKSYNIVTVRDSEGNGRSHGNDIHCPLILRHLPQGLPHDHQGLSHVSCLEESQCRVGLRQLKELLVLTSLCWREGRMKNTQLTICPKIVKWTFVAFNVLLGALGIVLFALGVADVTTAASVSAQFVADEDSLLVMSVVAGGVLLIVCGIVIFALAIVGVLGAIIQARPILAIYAIVLCAIVVIQFIGAIVSLVALSNSPTFIVRISSLLT